MIEGLLSFQNVFKIPELKRRVLFSAGMLVAYRIGAHVPTPGIDGHALARVFDQAQNTLLGMVDLFSGGNLRRLSIFALGIMPYISASIILQLLTVVVPTLERLQKEGQQGQPIARYAATGTGIEFGWSTPNGVTLAVATTGYEEGQVTPAGVSMRNWLNSLGANAGPS